MSHLTRCTAGVSYFEKSTDMAGSRSNRPTKHTYILQIKMASIRCPHGYRPIPWFYGPDLRRVRNKCPSNIHTMFLRSSSYTHPEINRFFQIAWCLYGHWDSADRLYCHRRPISAAVCLCSDRVYIAYIENCDLGIIARSYLCLGLVLSMDSHLSALSIYSRE